MLLGQQPNSCTAPSMVSMCRMSCTCTYLQLLWCTGERNATLEQAIVYLLLSNEAGNQPKVRQHSAFAGLADSSIGLESVQATLYVLQLQRQTGSALTCFNMSFALRSATGCCCCRCISSNRCAWRASGTCSMCGRRHPTSRSSLGFQSAMHSASSGCGIQHREHRCLLKQIVSQHALLHPG